MPAKRAKPGEKPMKPFNRNPAARKGPRKVTVHDESHDLLMRLARETQRAPADIVHLALSCFIAAMVHAGKHPEPQRRKRQLGVSRLPVKKIVEQALSKGRKGT
jgi:hypothetical protein